MGTFLLGQTRSIGTVVSNEHLRHHRGIPVDSVVGARGLGCAGQISSDKRSGAPMAVVARQVRRIAASFLSVTRHPV